MNTLVEYSKRFIGTPYIFGGEHPSYGFDCSGLVQIILQSVGVDPKGDQTAQMIFEHFLLNGDICQRAPGALVFYGKNVQAITHIAFMIDENRIIEAGGGDSTTTDIQRAIDRGAFVRIRPYNHRSDIVAILKPKYPEWMENV